MIENLPLLTPDASRTAVTMARCHTTLAARRQRLEARNRPKAGPVERLLAVGFCAIYLLSVAGNVFSVFAAF